MQWTGKLEGLCEIFKNTKLNEELKWGKPTYTLDGKLVAAIAVFKKHISLWFRQGVFLTDEHKKLMNAQDGISKAQLQWRFEENDEIDAKIVSEYIQEAIVNAENGKELKRARSKIVPIPAILKELFNEKLQIKESFYKLTPGRQREFLEYIGKAKR